MRSLSIAPLLLAVSAAAQQPEQVPVAASEQQVTGSLDFGYRWILGRGGSQDVYRSIVNLGEGPKLFSAGASLRNPGARLYDRVDVRATSWGGDPYNTARLDAARAGSYALRLDYRDVSYFNSIPSFANPLLSQGVLFSQRSLDTRRRLIDTQLDLRPGARLSPFLAYYHNSGFGRGVTTFVADGNEFPVGAGLRDSTDSYRGGVHVTFADWKITLEQGGTTFKDDQQVGFAGLNPGNRQVPLLGQDIFLRELRQAYGARGSGVFNRAALEARPWSSISFTGQFLYSKPSLDVNYLHQNSGNFVLFEALQVFTGQLDRSLSEASRPRSSGSWTTEVRPNSRIRVIQSWLTDRFHIAGGSMLASTITATSGVRTGQSSSVDRLVLNFNQHQVETLVDVSSSLSLRGGYRYEWGDTVVTPGLRLLPDPENAGMKRHVALAGGKVWLGANLDFQADLEAAAGDRTFFRIDLADYRRARVRGRYRPNKALTVTGSFAVLNNQNPARGVSFDYQSRQCSAAVLFTPGGGKRWSLVADYMRGAVRSNLPFLEPQDRTRESSVYRERGHYGGATLEVGLWRGLKLSAGGSLAVSAGSRPTRYYQPHGRFLLPLNRRMSWTAEWRWFGFSERQYAFENFHANLLSTGLRLGL